MTASPSLRAALAAFLFVIPTVAGAADRVPPNGIDGAVLVYDGIVPDSIRAKYIELAGGDRARIVIVAPGDKPELNKLASWLETESPMKPAHVAVINQGDPELSKALADATGVFLPPGRPPIDAAKRVLKRGGIVAASVRDVNDLGIVPDATFYTRSYGGFGGTKIPVTPGKVAIGLTEDSAVVIKGRDIRVINRPVFVTLAEGAGRPAKVMEWKPGSVADFTTLRKAAVARTEAPFPPKDAAIPEVPSGALLIVGGGGMPADVTKKFIDLAGGPESLIVTLPISMPDSQITGREDRFLKRAGAKNVVMIKARELADVEDPKNLELLKKAKGVWFGGGRQWNFMDAYAGTKFEKELHDVLKRGGVIGGSSAGASIQGEYMCRGDPMGPNPIMCEGYERGLGFLPGVGIDQHFTQRKRQPDMSALMKAYPQLLGIGLDEATAIVVKGHVAEVMGRGKAHFYDRRKPVEDGKPDYETVAAGGRYDLKVRSVAPTGERVAAHVGIFLDAMPARNIGPANMGGRVVDISVAEGNPKIILVATATGGVWKTANGGDTWVPVFDHEGAASVGAVAIAASNPNVIYVGTGEGNPRNSVSSGDGVYKSVDGGRAWQHLGLTDTRQIGRIVVHPKNPDVAYVAAVGHVWGPNPERGLYKTADGGKTWQKSKYIDENTGVVDVAMDPTDPNTLYISTYHVRRDGFSGGNPAVQTGPNTGLYKTTDGGKTWVKMTAGLSERPLGRCGFAIDRKDPNTVYAVIQTDQTSVTTAGQMPRAGEIAATGGVFRSRDKGATWKKLNDLCPRPFYYGQIRIDPNDSERIYVLGVGFYVSDDGGFTFTAAQRIGAHPDHHALWIDPKDSKRLVLGNDGGLWVSKDRAKTFEPIRAMAIGQFYGVAADMRTPYHVYGGLQDNGSWGGPSATRAAEGITQADWRRVAGADGFQCAVDPTDPTIVYAEGQYGRLQRITVRGDRPVSKAIQPRAERNAPPYRFNWNAPLLLSPHDPKTVYFGGNFLFMSTNRGDSWKAVSPDLTLGKPGASADFGHTLTAIAESPVTAGVLWASSDDGRLHVSRDGGKTWIDLSKNIPNLPQARTINCIECSRFDAGTAFVAIDRHRNDDLRPYLFKTTDYGATWTPLGNGLPQDAPLNVVRESSRSKNLLFVGTDVGLYVSLDGGAEWYHYRGLPTVPVHDLLIHPRDRDLIIGTHGRSIYVMDVAPLEELTEPIRKSLAHLFAIKPATLFDLRKPETPTPAGQFRGTNPPFGAVVSYYLSSAPAVPVTLTVQDASGRTIATLPGAREAGYHRAVWNLRAGDKFVEPGDYEVTLTVDGKTVARTVTVTR